MKAALLLVATIMVSQRLEYWFFQVMRWPARR
jgi:hypothetical protein